LFVGAVTATAFITRVAKDALERAIEEHEGSAAEGAELLVQKLGRRRKHKRRRWNETRSQDAESPKGHAPRCPFKQNEVERGKGRSNRPVQGAEVGLEEGGAKGVLVRIEGVIVA